MVGPNVYPGRWPIKNFLWRHRGQARPGIFLGELPLTATTRRNQLNPSDFDFRSQGLSGPGSTEVGDHMGTLDAVHSFEHPRCTSPRRLSRPSHHLEHARFPFLTRRCAAHTQQTHPRPNARTHRVHAPPHRCTPRPPLTLASYPRTCSRPLLSVADALPPGGRGGAGWVGQRPQKSLCT